MNDDLAARIAARPAPKVTPDRIASLIVSEDYHRLTGTLTVAVLTLANGFTVTGESPCASPENYDEQIGNEIARKNAVAKIWGLEGYLLRQTLHLSDTAVIGPRRGFGRYVGTKVLNAQPMTRQQYVAFRGWQMPADENPEDEGYLVEYTDKQQDHVLGFQGYVSWSPKDVFEAAYMRVDTAPTVTTIAPASALPEYQQRMIAEYRELADRMGKLTGFFGTGIYSALPLAERERMRKQHLYMGLYLQVLGERLISKSIELP